MLTRKEIRDVNDAVRTLRYAPAEVIECTISQLAQKGAWLHAWALSAQAGK